MRQLWGDNIELRRNLRPALGRVFPPCRARRRDRRYGRLRDPDRLGCYRSGNRRFGCIHCVLPIVGQQRRYQPEGFNFFFQTCQFEFLLSKNFVDILHSWAFFQLLECVRMNAL